MSELANRISYLRQVPLFGSLSHDELLRVAALAGEEHYRQGSIIARQGELGTTFYVLMTGKLAVWAIDPRGDERFREYLSPGDSFGETSLLIGEPRDATIEVVEDAHLLYLNKRDFEPLVSSYPDIRSNLRISRTVRRKLAAPHFPWQREGEVTILVSRKHGFVLLRSLIIPLPLLLLAFFILWLISRLSSDPRILGIAGGFLFGLPTLLVVWLYLDWRNDYYVITNQRVMHIEKIILFYESRIETTLDRIQDVTTVVSGIPPRLLGYADIRIQTAGTEGAIFFRYIGDPERVKEAIFEQVRRAKAQERAEERDRIRDEMSRHFGTAEPRVPDPPQNSKDPTPEVAQTSSPSLVLEVFGKTFGYFVPVMRVEEGSTVIWRKHWLILLRRTWRLLGVLFLWPALLIFFTASLRARIAVLMVVLINVAWLLWRYEDWRNDIYILTDERIIDVEKRPLGFFEDRREASLSQIQDIRFVIPNILANLFNYGDVKIETAGQVGLFTFDRVYNPRGVQEELFNRWAVYREREDRSAARARETQLRDWITVYDEILTQRNS